MKNQTDNEKGNLYSGVSGGYSLNRAVPPPEPPKYKYGVIKLIAAIILFLIYSVATTVFFISLTKKIFKSTPTEQPVYTVTLHYLNTAEEVSVQRKQKYSPPAPEEYNGFTVVGWYKDSECSIKAAETITIEKGFHLYLSAEKIENDGIYRYNYQTKNLFFAGIAAESESTEITVLQTVTNISVTGIAKKLKNVSSLTKISIGTNILRIPQDAFSGCLYLQEVQTTGKLIEIGNAAFKGCKNLQTFDFQEGLAYIGAEAFNNTALAALRIPASLQHIGNAAFGNIDTLKNIEVAAGNTKYCVIGKSLLQRQPRTVVVELNEEMRAE